MGRRAAISHFMANDLINPFRSRLPAEAGPKLWAEIDATLTARRVVKGGQPYLAEKGQGLRIEWHCRRGRIHLSTYAVSG